MTLRWPERLSGAGQNTANPLEFEILAEKASALRRAGEQVEKALEKLRSAPAGSSERHTCLKEAAEAVYSYFIQRELCGLRRHHDVIREYGIPNEVLVRLGAK